MSNTLMKEVAPADQEVAPRAETPLTVDDVDDKAEPGDGPVRIDPQGRIVLPLPPEARRELGVDEGDELCVLVEDEMIKLMTRERLIRFIQEEVAKVPYEGSMVDELIAERRQEAERERRELEEGL